MTPVEIVAVVIAGTSLAGGGSAAGASGEAPWPVQPAHPLPLQRQRAARDALDAALRLANAEHAILVPASLAAVPLPAARLSDPARVRPRSRYSKRSSSARPALT